MWGNMGQVLLAFMPLCIIFKVYLFMSYTLKHIILKYTVSSKTLNSESVENIGCFGGVSTFSFNMDIPTSNNQTINIHTPGTHKLCLNSIIYLNKHNII